MHLNILISAENLLLTLFGISIAVSGGYMTVYLRFFPQKKLFYSLRRFFAGAAASDKGKRLSTEKGISSFSASAAALAGTLGTGNIAGVAAALTSGGPGAVFWMWCSAILGMSLKYAEILLSVHFSKDREGGPMYYISRAFGSEKLSWVFAVGCIGASFGVGNLAQVNAAADSIESAFGLPQLITGGLIACCAGIVMMGGKKRIAAASARLVPLMGGIYLVGAALVILPRLHLLPQLFELIVSDAFTPRSAFGGIIGVMTSRAFRSGITRGVFTNEAGLGSAPIIHAASDEGNPAEEGLWGVAEVALDTLVMCTMTAAVILLTVGLDSGLDGAELTLAAFSDVFGKGAAGFLGIATLMFAFSSLLTWSWCGESALRYLGGGKMGLFVYRALFLGAAVFGGIIPVQTVLAISDLLNFYMCLPNLLAIFRLKKIVLQESDKISSHTGKLYSERASSCPFIQSNK